MRHLDKITIISALVGLLIVFTTIVLLYNQVDNILTNDDKKYIPLYLSNILPPKENRNYQNELDFILQVQSSVLNIAYQDNALPFNEEREPKDVYLTKSGLCHDRSRVIEKILRYSGFKTRHIAIYSTKKTDSSIKSLLTRETSSHAVTEVLTKKGWLVVDSNDAWVSVDINGNPKSIEHIHSDVMNSDKIIWKEKPPSNIYEEPFTYVYGLYSRHGRFYPPYNFIPDVNYPEFIQNIIN